MQNFISTRPLSVVVSFFVCLWNVITGLVVAIPYGGLLLSHNSLTDSSEGLTAWSAGTNFITLTVVAAALVIPLVEVAALYRDSRLGYRLLGYGTGLSTILSLSANIFPARCLLEAGLIAWMAYELDGFNILTWISDKVINPQTVCAARVTPASPTSTPAETQSSN